MQSYLIFHLTFFLIFKIKLSQLLLTRRDLIQPKYNISLRQQTLPINAWLITSLYLVSLHTESHG